MPPARRLTLAAALLLATVVLARPLPLALFGVDGACYARIAKDLAARPVSTWADVRWMDGAFHEHPPLALWLEAAWFRLTGASAAAAVWLARLYALALGLVVWLTARRLAGEQVAALSLVGLVTLPAFLQESQNPMFELPLTLALAVALDAATRLSTSRAAVAQYALAVVAAFWVKGAVALAGFAVLAWALWAGAPWRRLLAAGAAALGLGAATVLGFEALCRAQGLAPYFQAYAQHQLVTSFVEGRANPQSSPLYYLGTLVRWELALLLALPLVALAWRRQERGWRQLVALGLWHAAVVVVGFSLARQKNEWYLAPLLPAAAWVVGGALAALPARVLRFAPHAAAVAAAGWLTFTLAVGTRADTERQAAIRAVTATPLDARGAAVANCSVLGDWLAQHLFAFHWGAARVGCDAPAGWRFDGHALTALQKAD